MRKSFKLSSFKHAYNGIKYLLNEGNFRVHCLISAVVIAFSIVLKIKTTHWIAILLCIAIVLFAEAINTAIEYICDIIKPDFDQRIKRIKDISAAAVLICALISATIGCIIFTPYLITHF